MLFSSLSRPYSSKAVRPARIVLNGAGSTACDVFRLHEIRAHMQPLVLTPPPIACTLSLAQGGQSVRHEQGRAAEPAAVDGHVFGHGGILPQGCDPH